MSDAVRARISERDPGRHLALAGYLIKIPLALAVITIFRWQLAAYGSVTSPDLFAVFVVGLMCLSAATLIHTVAGLLALKNYPGTPGVFMRTTGATLDVLWLLAGYAVSGFAALPFPVLLILSIGLSGLHLGFYPLLFVTTVAGGGFAALHQFLEVPANPLYTGQTQVGLFLGVGLISAVAGNRIRAAGWMLSRLGSALHLVEDRHRSLLDALPLGLLRIRGEDVDANAAALRLFPEVAPEAASGSAAALLAHLERDLQLRQAVQAVLRPEPGGDDLVIEGTLRVEGEGESRWIDWKVLPGEVPAAPVKRASLFALGSAAPGPHPSDSLSSTERTALLLLMDVTARRQIEQADRRADRLAAVAELSAGLAHEIRNPIAALRSSCEQLDECPGLDETDRRLLGIAVRESDRINALVSEFLSFARAGGEGADHHRLEELIRPAIEISRPGARTHDIEVLVDLSDPGAAVWIDAELLHRAVSNLLLNAVAFTPPGGSVVIRLALSPDGQHLHGAVEDTGPGIPVAAREKIFQPFYTTRKGGSGLGLSIAARSIALLGGRLVLDTAGASGSRFTFTVPTAAPEPPRLS